MLRFNDAANAALLLHQPADQQGYIANLGNRRGKILHDRRLTCPEIPGETAQGGGHTLSRNHKEQDNEDARGNRCV